MTLVILIGLVLAFVLGARFLKILDRVVDLLYMMPLCEDESEEPEEE